MYVCMFIYISYSLILLFNRALLRLVSPQTNSAFSTNQTDAFFFKIKPL